MRSATGCLQSKRTGTRAPSSGSIVSVQRLFTWQKVLSGWEVGVYYRKVKDKQIEN